MSGSKAELSQQQKAIQLGKVHYSIGKESTGDKCFVNNHGIERLVTIAWKDSRFSFRQENFLLRDKILTVYG